TVASEAWASHVSTRDTSRPGWVYVTYWNDTPTTRFNDEIIAIKMGGTGAVERYGQYHSDFENTTGLTGTYEAQYSNYDYRSQAHAVPSPDGTRVIFASNWVYQGNGGAAIQDYVIDARSLAATPPAAPTNLVAAAAANGTQVNLTWTDNSTNETGFKVYKSTDGVNFALLATAGANATSYSWTGAAQGGTYSFRVTAYNAAGESAVSNTATATAGARKSVA